MLLPGAATILVIAASISYAVVCALIACIAAMLLERVFGFIVGLTNDHEKYWSGAGQKYYHWYFQTKNRFFAIFWSALALSLYTLFGLWLAVVDKISSL